MKNKNSFVVAIVVVMCITLVIACKKNDSSPQKTTLDQSIMLANYSDNIIVPAYTSLAAEADKLVTASNTFSTTPTSENLVSLQNEFTVAYKAWMHCEPFNFGPADDVVMLETAISFPAKPDLIETELSGTSEFTDAYVNSLGAQKKGLAALAYLIFVRNDDVNASASLDKFVSAANGERRKSYAVALSKNIAASAHTVLDGWNNGYSATFKTNTGTELNTSLSLLLNNMVVALENSKNKRIGIPIGRKDNFTEGPTDATALELPNTELAKTMLEEATVALSNEFQGRSSKGDGVGFDDYVATLKVASGNTTLENAINTELTNYKADIAAIGDPMQTTIATDPTPVYTSWVQSKKLLVLLKVDLSSNLGILITFSDNDGD